MAINYSELFCEAIDLIVKERLTQIKYDQTKVCTIVDDSKKSEGIYIVSNGSAKFEAYGDDSYRIGNTVYVEIPNGDMNEQKFIKGKQTNKSANEPYVYHNPFDTLVDITGNLVTNVAGVKGLIANDPGDDGSGTYQTIWEWNPEDNKTPLTGYSRLGIQAQFHTALNPFYINTYSLEDNFLISSELTNVIAGEYGLRLRVYAIQQTTQTDTTTRTDAYFDFYLNTNNMNGNPYDFDSYFQQQIVFDIKDIEAIKKMELQFYQKRGTFVDANGRAKPYQIFLDGTNVAVNYEPPNLFVKDPYVCVGYDTSEFDTEKVQIYTLNTPTYSAAETSAAANHKELNLRWIHKDSSGAYISVDDKDPMEYTVFWYRFEHGHASADQYSGVYWRLLSIQDVYSVSDDSGKIVIDTYYGAETDISETHKFYNQWLKLKEENADWISYNNMAAADAELVQREPDFFKSWLIPDVTKAQEQVKAIIVYDGNYYVSNILTITNEQEVVNQATLAAIDALSINCEDGTFGNYRIYQLGNDLIDQAQSKVSREFKAYFNLPNEPMDENGNPIYSELTEADFIKWTIPATRSMIIMDGVAATGDSYIITYVKNEDGSINNSVPYRIRGYYSQSYDNNTVQCEVLKSGVHYVASKELTFGPQGTSGTDVTFVLDFDDIEVLTIDNSDITVSVTARLYDYENKEIDISEKTIKWTLINSDKEIVKSVAATNNTNVILELKDLSGNYFTTLKATMTDWGDTILEAYLPIPVRSTKNYKYISGTTYLMYNSAGYIDTYYSNPYILYFKESDTSGIIGLSSINDITVESNINDETYAPQINTRTYEGIAKYYLNPLDIYVKDGVNNFGITIKHKNSIVWYQPIYIFQNRYPSKMLNQWDGKLEIDESKGAVLATKIAAGSKDKDTNTFSGVILGDWKDESNEASITEHTGLYGFHQGVQSFGFKDDGTAFIGKAGVGRIEFDGNQGIIKSSLYDEDNIKRGMIIDLTGNTSNNWIPSITAYDFTLEADGYDTATDGKYLRITTSTYDEGGKALQIGSGNNEFYVNWDGSLVANSGTFKGIINATEGGTIGGWTIDSFGLWSGSTYLYPGGITGAYISSSTIDGGSITGTNISGSNISVSNALNIYGYVMVYDTDKNHIGYFGQMDSWENSIVTGLGLQYSGSTSVLQLTNDNSAIKHGSSSVTCGDGVINIVTNLHTSNESFITLGSKTISLFSNQNEVEVYQNGHANIHAGNIADWLVNNYTPVAVFG